MVTEGDTVMFTLGLTPVPDLGSSTQVEFIVSGLSGYDITAGDFTLTAPDSANLMMNDLRGTVNIGNEGGTGQIEITLMAIDDADAQAETLEFIAFNSRLHSARIPITINPLPPLSRAISVSASTTAIIEGNTATITLTATPAPAVGEHVRVRFSITGMNITARDYTLTAPASAMLMPAEGMVNIGNANGPGRQTLVLTTTADVDVRAKTLQLTVIDGEGYTVSSPPDNSVSVRIDPIPSSGRPTIHVSANPLTIAEDGATTITMTASPAPDSSLPVNFSIAGANITAGDFTLTAPDSASLVLTNLTGMVEIGSRGAVEVMLTAKDEAGSMADT